MILTELAAQLTERLKLPLPGNAAHDLMRATPMGELRPKFEHKIPPKPGSVLILFYQDNEQIKFPLTKRPDYNGTHAGQVSLPGGKAELGEDFVQTALREAEVVFRIERPQHDRKDHPVGGVHDIGRGADREKRRAGCGTDFCGM